MLHRTTPHQINSLKADEVFVFGSNLAGRHGKGAALFARRWLGAVYGVAEGPTGRCYAIPTKNKGISGPLAIEEIAEGVNAFLEYAARNPAQTFLVTPIGCGLAYYSQHQIAPLFAGAVALENVHLPAKFWAVLQEMGLFESDEGEEGSVERSPTAA